MRVISSAAVGLAFIVFAAGCGSAEESTVSSAERLAVDDLRMLVTVSPAASGWEWNVEPKTREASPPLKPPPANPAQALQQALTDAYEDAGLIHSATSSWVDSATGKKASSFANLVDTAAAAASVMSAEYEFTQSWFPEFEGQTIHDIDAGGIGVERWAVRGGRGDAGFVEIGWTRGNAVLAVYVSCNPCESDVAEAARRWAEKIDAAARSAAG